LSWKHGWLALAAMLLAPGAGATEAAWTIADNTPPYVTSADTLGEADASQTTDVTIWLKPHDRPGMDALARDLYDPASPRYHQWLSPTEIAGRFGPSAAEARTVRTFLEANRLHVVLADPQNFFVRARGKVADVEQAFRVRLRNYRVGDKVVRANDRDPTVGGAAGAFVRVVGGLDSGEYTHPLIVRTAAGFAGPADRVEAKKTADPAFYTPDCFDATTQKFTTNNQGQRPIGNYTGNHINLGTLTSAGCGYSPAALYRAYDLESLFKEGFTGKGQTIVIVDWCGSSTVESDANAFSKRFGLPALTAANFKIIYTPTSSSCIAEDQVEINLDVEWAHAFAPSAKIDLVVPPTAAFEDVDEAMFHAVNYGLGRSISGSYGSPENQTPDSVLDTENLISEIAAVSGISTNYSSGDSGDFGSGGTQTVNAPADSPWATGVGGVSLALKADKSIAWQAGWGNNETLLAQFGQISSPPVPQYFAFGAGGGVSTCAKKDAKLNCISGFAKPKFQSALPGKNRMVPDVAWLADPFTGAVIAISVPGQQPSQVWEVVGGTSLAAPMFSALWAIANEEAGKPLGLAAPYLYAMPKGALTDIVPVGSKSNLTAVIDGKRGTTHLNANHVIGGAAPLTPDDFVSALWDYGEGYQTAVAISFGTDCVVAKVESGTPCTSPNALGTKPGWDDVTGMGVPNGRRFADFFRSTKVHAEQ
jgi:subtilase family serine protease